MGGGRSFRKEKIRREVSPKVLSTHLEPPVQLHDDGWPAVVTII